MTWHEGEGSASPTGMRGAWTRDDAGMPRPDVGPGLYADLARALGAVQREIAAEGLAGLGPAEFDPRRAA